MSVGAGVPGMLPWHPQFLADQLTLHISTRGHIMPTTLLLGIHRPSYGPELLQYVHHVYAALNTSCAIF